MVTDFKREIEEKYKELDIEVVKEMAESTVKETKSNEVDNALFTTNAVSIADLKGGSNAAAVTSQSRRNKDIICMGIADEIKVGFVGLTPNVDEASKDLRTFVDSNTAEEMINIVEDIISSHRSEIEYLSTLYHVLIKCSVPGLITVKGLKNDVDNVLAALVRIQKRSEIEQQKTKLCGELTPQGEHVLDSQESWKWKESSKLHRAKFKKLLEYRKQRPDDVEEICGVLVCCSKDFIIGKGADGTVVYVGLGKDGVERAVKRLLKDVCTTVAEQEIKVLKESKAIDSNNVVKYWFLDESSDKQFRFLVLDLCEETLESYVDRKSADDLSRTAREIIRQILKGLADLHRDPNPILHRDLKPSNILRDVHDKWLLADFGISRVMETDETTYKSEQRGTRHWRAVETYQSNDTSDDGKVRYKKESDIQVAGMVAYYIATKGKHPFGKMFDRERNLIEGNPVDLRELKDEALKDLLAWMLSHKPEDRPMAEVALRHPYFQTENERFEMLVNMGKQREIKTEDVSSNVVQQLNSDTTDWRTLLDADALTYFCTDFVRSIPNAFRYGSSWTECLRLIRNVNEHWTDAPCTTPIPNTLIPFGGPHGYFLKVFPNLPVVVHRIVRSCDWKERQDLEKYFKLEGSNKTN